MATAAERIVSAIIDAVQVRFKEQVEEERRYVIEGTERLGPAERKIAMNRARLRRERIDALRASITLLYAMKNHHQEVIALLRAHAKRDHEAKNGNANSAASTEEEPPEPDAA